MALKDAKMFELVVFSIPIKHIRKLSKERVQNVPSEGTESFWSLRAGCIVCLGSLTSESEETRMKLLLCFPAVNAFPFPFLAAALPGLGFVPQTCFLAAWRSDAGGTLTFHFRSTTGLR